MARNAGWMLFGQGAGVLLQAANFIVLARLLGSAEYGVFVGAFAFTSLVSQYSALGMGGIFMRYVSGARKGFEVYWGNIVFVNFTLGPLLSLGLYLLAPRLLNTESASIVAFAAVANCIFAQITLETGRVFQCFEKMWITAILNLLTNLLRVIAATVMFFGLHHATALQWSVASACVSLVSALLAVSAVTYQLGLPKIKMRLILKNTIEGAGFAFASSTTVAYNDLDKTMLSHYGMNAANGIYAMAYRIIDIATIPIFAVRDAALPSLYQKGRDEGVRSSAELGRRLLQRVLPLSAVLSLVMFAAAPLIPLLIGKSFAESVLALRLLCLIPIFRSVHQMTGCALTGAGYQNSRTVAQLCATLLNFILNFFWIPRFGWIGAAWSSLLTDAALGLMNYAILRVCMMMSAAQVST